MTIVVIDANNLFLVLEISVGFFLMSLITFNNNSQVSFVFIMHVCAHFPVFYPHRHGLTECVF